MIDEGASATPPNSSTGGATNSGETPEVHAELEKRLAKLLQNDTGFSAFPGMEDVSQLDKFQIQRLLGGGGFGVVYLADDLGNDRQVALKVPRPEVLLNAESRNRFATEAKLAAKLKHPGIVELLEAETSGPTPYIVSAYCPGPDLAKWLAEQSESPPWRDSVKLMIEVCDAVEYAHQQGVFHRDLKPANIVLAVGGEATTADRLTHFCPKVTDFGLAKLIDPELTNTRSSLLIGTPMYMSPEQVEPGAVADTAAVDIYSLGVILFELLTGQYPVQGTSYFEVLENIRSLPPTRLRTLRRDLPEQLDKICRTCLQPNPRARYSSVAELSADLRIALEGGSVVGQRSSLVSRFCYWASRPRRVATAGRFMLVHSVILGVWVFIVVGFSFRFGVVSWAEYSQQWRDALLVTCSNVAPSIWVGWQLIRGKRWPAWIGLAASLLNIPPLTIAIFGKPLLFQGIYLDLHPFFAFTVHTVLLMCSLIQLFLVSCVVASNRKLPGQ